MRRVFGFGDARREATFFTAHQKQQKIQRIHRYTRAVYSGSGTRGEKLLSLLSTKNKRRYSEYTRRVFGCGNARRDATLFTVHKKTREDTANTRAVHSGSGTRGEKLLSLLSTKIKRRYYEYTRGVFGFGGARREATFFTAHQKQDKKQRIHAPCIRVRGRAERSYFLYCPPKTKEDTANKIGRAHV